MRLSFSNRVFSVCFLASLAQGVGATDEAGALSAFEGLMSVPVRVASGFDEALGDAPAAMIIITQEDIRKRGYTHIDEMLYEVTGFDVVGTFFPNAYQRGYRTTSTQRTLLMVNGVVDNNLWSHSAVLSRQYPLSNVERIEILYGPSSAVYGANAFLGIINIVTKTADTLKAGEDFLRVEGQYGSYASRAVDMAMGKRFENGIGYSFSAKYFRSDEPDLDDFPKQWGYLSEDWSQNAEVWGSLLSHSNRGVQLGDYYDAAENWGVIGDVNYGDWSVGVLAWEVRESYGAYYASDRAQNNAPWNHDSYQYYLKHDKKMEDLRVTTMGLYRSSRIWGGWAEANPAEPPAGSDDTFFSLLNYSSWHTQNESWLVRQDYDYQFSKHFRLLGGVKYEHKRLTKSYDYCSYWADAYCSTLVEGDTGRYGFGSGIFYSTDSEPVFKAGFAEEMPEENRITTIDKGVYLQGVWDVEKWRVNVGMRYDDNSLYGSSVNPRASVIYKWSEDTTLKLLYGTAFQEPPPFLLWGGWTGRAANPSLQPEQASNLEFIVMHRMSNWLHDLSLYAAKYEHVIKEEAENNGERDVWGVEYRGRYVFNNFLEAPDISGYLYYTYTDVTSSIYYDHETNQWLDGDAELGDIAPHKINIGVNVPLSPEWAVNLSANYMSERELYLRNPLRAQGEKLEDQLILNANVSYHLKPFKLTFKVRNLLDTGYYHPGGARANSGNDFTQRSQGFDNSLIPQPGRSYWLNLMWEWE